MDLPGAINFLDGIAGGAGIAADSNALYRISFDGNFKKLVTSVSNLTRLAVDQNGDVFVQSGSPAEVSKVDMLCGVKSRITGALPALQGNFDVDALGRIVFADFAP